VRNLREALVDPQTVHNEMVIEGHDGELAMHLVGSPIRMSGAPVGMRRPPPRLGEHTDEVMAEAQGLAIVHSAR
jgi:formyl-CoA transferase